MCALVSVLALWVLGLFAQAQAAELEWPIWGSQAKAATALAMVEQFNSEHPDIKVNATRVGGIAAYTERLLVRSAADALPDIFDVPAALREVIFGGGQALLLDEWLAKSGIDVGAYFPPAWESSMWEGHYYGVPTSGNVGASLAIIWLPEKFERAGLPGPHEGWTFSEYAAIARRLTEFGPEGIPTQWGTETENFVRMWPALVWSNGAEIYDEANRKVLLDDAKARDALGWVQSLRYPDQISNTWGLNENQAAMGPRPLVGALRQFPGELTANGVEWRIAFFPRGDDAEQSYVPLGGGLGGGTEMIAVSSRSPHQEAALTFLAWWHREENLRRLVFEFGEFPILREHALDPAFLTRDEPPYDLSVLFAQPARQEPTHLPGWTAFTGEVAQAVSSTLNDPTQNVTNLIYANLERWENVLFGD